jgi:CoA transferase family III
VHTDDTELPRSTAGPSREGQLSDLLVIDLSRAVAGPHAAMMLGDLGARVIKVEQPGHGDEARDWGPPFVQGSDGQPVSTYFLAANRNKESITLDLKNADDMTHLRHLLAMADVLIENFRPATLTRLGLTEQTLLALNPRLVVLAISGFGHPRRCFLLTRGDGGPRTSGSCRCPSRAGADHRRGLPMGPDQVSRTPRRRPARLTRADPAAWPSAPLLRRQQRRGSRNDPAAPSAAAGVGREQREP